MAKKNEFARRQKNALNAEEAERLFSTVDETGHSNEEQARKQRKRRKEKGVAVDIDPLSGQDPSGSNVGQVIAKTAVGFVVALLVLVIAAQVFYGFLRRSNTANLSEHANVLTVASALRGGVEWGNGFTQFPEDYSVQEADENTGRIEVTVIDTSSENTLEAFAGSNIQATAFSVNALLNPNINEVIYHVNVHIDEKGKVQRSTWFGFIKPTGTVTSFVTFKWTKTQTDSGISFNCSISGMDEAMQSELRTQITTSFTPVQILNLVTNNQSDTTSALLSRTGATQEEGAASTSGTTDAQSTSSNASASGAGEESSEQSSEQTTKQTSDASSTTSTQTGQQTSAVDDGSKI